MNKNRIYFTFLMTHLRMNGYDVSHTIFNNVSNGIIYKNYLQVTGKNVRGWVFHEPPFADKKHFIFFDHIQCFDQPSNCPLILPLPKTKEHINFILKKLEWVGSKDGLSASNSYLTEQWINDYPRALKINLILKDFDKIG